MKPYRGVSDGALAISAFEPPRRVVFQARMGAVRAVITMAVEPETSGARVTRQVEMASSGVFRLLAPVVKPMFRKAVAGHLANLKRVLESS